MSAPPRRVMVTTVPFGVGDTRPLAALKSAGVELVTNPIGRRLKATEVAEVIAGFPVVIAGTEPIMADALASCPGLKGICRVGIGLDSVDLLAARKLGIAVSYTPDGPSPAVAELTVGLIIDLLRGVGMADRAMRGGGWERTAGARIATSCIGVVGVGRIGRRVIRHLQGGFAGVRILANDLVPDPTLDAVEWVDKDTLYREADVVTLHVPLGAATRDMLGGQELAMMKRTAALVNTARGGIVSEQALLQALRSGTIRAAALDVFTEEPYRGELAQLPNILLTSHMGSMTADCRARMEIEATHEAIRILDGEPLRSPVPEEEYRLAERRSRG
jgi:D-3-phosphoglycerate dehydrogenase